MSNWQNNIIGIEERDPRELMPNPLNTKEHGEYQKKVMTGLVSEVGWVQAVIFNKRTGRLLDGHMRVELAIQNGEKTVPVTIVDVSEEDEKKILLLFDPIGGLATQRSEKVKELVETVNLRSASARDLASNIAKKNRIDTDKYKDDGGDGEAKKDEAVQQMETQAGDVYNITDTSTGHVHRLLVGDNTDDKLWKKLFGKVRPILTVTSPPYNQKINKFKPSGMQKEAPNFVDRMASSYMDDLPEDEYQDLQVAMVDRIMDFLGENGSLFYNHKIRYRDKQIIHPMQWLSRIKYSIRQEIIWDRGISIALNARMFIPIDERIYWIKKSDDFIFNDETEIKAWSTVWKFAARNEVAVSAAFPYELPYRCIIACSQKGDAIFDPYSGSGTTIIAAHRTGRIGYGIEIDPDHAARSLERFIKEGLVITKAK